MELPTTTTKNIDEHAFKAKVSKSPVRSKAANVNAMVVVVPLVSLSALIALGALPRVFQNQALVNSANRQIARAPGVSYVVAQPGSPVEVFELPGTTQAIQDANIYARVDGYIHKRYVDIGDRVHAGQILADIDTPELDQQVHAATSAVEQATANLENVKDALSKAESDQRTSVANVAKAKTNLQYYTVEVARYKELSAEGAVSLETSDSQIQAYNAGISTLEAMEAAQKSAEASVRSAKASVHVAEAALNAAIAQRDQYEATRSFRKVTALFDGIITQRNVDAGALVTSGSSTNNTVLFELARSDVLRIFVYVPEQYIPDIYASEQALLAFQEYPGKDFIGTVSHVAGGVDPTSKTLQVEIHVKNPDGKLLPGMYAQVKFQSKAHERLAVVPATAVQTRPNGDYMYTIDDKNRVHMHKIEVGLDLGGEFEIAKGIIAGDKVIISPSDEVQDGILVSPVALAGSS